MLHILYLFFTAPLEFLMRLVLEWGFSWTHSWGWSVVLLSLAVNTAILPIYNWAERRQEDVRKLRRSMSKHEAMLRECFMGQERFAVLSALRRVSGYNWRLTLRASVGLLFQIPFFIAAYHLLSNFTPLQGQSFGPLSNLGAPDALLSLGDFGINMLPIAMTAVNLFSAFFYTRNLTCGDKALIYGMGSIFLFLLYNAASALTLYWTLNNVYSLGKNIVEKGWMRRPGWLAFRALCQGSLPEAVSAQTFGFHFARFLKAMRISFSVGAIVWMYISTIALKRTYNLLSSELESAIWLLAEQCAHTALLAAAILALFAPFHPRRKFAWPTSLLAVCVAVLFLCRLKLFSHGLAIEHGHFLADMQDGRYGVYFIVWALGIFGIGKYQDKLAEIFPTSGRALLVWLNFAPSERAREGKPLAPSQRDTFVMACLMGTTCGVFLWFFVPFCTYFHNTNEFGLNGWELFWKVLPGSLLTIISATLSLMATTYFLPAEWIQLPWKREVGTCAKVNIVYVVVLAFLFLLWLEGTMLSYGLPLLDGKQHLFHSKNRMLLDTCVWGLLILLSIRYWRVCARNMISCVFLFIIMVAISFYEISAIKVEKIDARNFQPIEGLSLVDEETLFTNLRFSRTNNIIVFLVDSLDTLAFEKTVEVYPELKNILNGFTVFQENLGTGGLTPQALPQILSGEIYNKDKHGPFSTFVEHALVGESSMAADAMRAGRKVFIGANFWNIQHTDKATDIILNKGFALTDNVHNILFRFYPYYFKHLFYEKINVKNISVNIEENNITIPDYIKGNDRNKMKFNMLIRQMDELIDEPVFQFIWFFGVHTPYTKNNIIETTKEFINDFSQFLEYAKEKGIYDKTTFILMADHGMFDHRHFYPERHGKLPTIFFPLLTIKTKDSTRYQVNNALTSSANVREIIHQFYLDGDLKSALNDYIINITDNRLLFRPGLGTFEAKGKFNSLTMRRIDKKNERKVYDNILYSFDENDEKFQYPYHDIDIGDVDDSNVARSFGGIALRNVIFFKRNVRFLYGGSPNSQKKITFQISSFTNKGAIEIQDAISGNKVLWKENGNIEILCMVDHNGYINLYFTPIINQSNIINYMVIQDKFDAPPEFPPLHK